MEEKSIKRRAYFSLFKGLFLVVILYLSLAIILPDVIFSISRFYVIGALALIIWMVYLTKAIPRCHKCGYGVFSIFEIKRVPIIVKSIVGKHCSNCGAVLK